MGFDTEEFGSSPFGPTIIFTSKVLIRSTVLCGASWRAIPLLLISLNGNASARLAAPIPFSIYGGYCLDR